MEQSTDVSETRRYLLGRLDPAAEKSVERRLMTEQEYLDELSAEEDELIDDYLGGVLSRAEREQFETYFLAAPERGRKLEFARLLRGYLEKEADAPSPAQAGPEVRPPSQFWAALSAFFKTRRVAGGALAAVFLLVLGVVLIGPRLRRESPGPRPAENVSVPGGGAEGPRAALGPVLAVTLSPGVVRSSAKYGRIVITPDVNTVQLRLELMADQHRRYGAAVRAEDDEIFAQSGLEAVSSGADKVVLVNVSAKLLPPGDYRIRLTGEAPDGSFEDVGSYDFKVAAR